MKKLMIALAAAALVGAANAAASYNYNSMLYFKPYTACDTGNHTSWYKMYALEESDWKGVSGTTTVKAFSDWLGGDYSANASAVVGSAQALTDVDWTVNPEESYYEQLKMNGTNGSNLDKGVIVFMYQDDSDNYAFAVEQSGRSSRWDVCNDGYYTSKALSWTAVPEPTSALLMLLGMAGLALKRKRA